MQVDEATISRKMHTLRHKQPGTSHTALVPRDRGEQQPTPAPSHGAQQQQKVQPLWDGQAGS